MDLMPGERPSVPKPPLAGARIWKFRRLAAGIVAVPLALGAAPPFDPKPWLEDLDQARDAFATKYANLEWAAFEREADLSTLFADTRTRVENASNIADARDAFDGLARRLGDGHVRFRWPIPRPTRVPSATCTDLGYDPRMLGAPLAALGPGFVPLASAPAAEFPAGMIQVGEHKIGVVKIGLFSARGYPHLCTAALAALGVVPGSPCDQTCSDRIDEWALARMTNDLMAQLRAIKASGADVLLVDIAGNGGGTEWAEAAARMVTGVRLRSSRVGFVRGSHWADAFAKKESQLRTAARNASREDRAALTWLADEVAARRRQALAPCDSSPLWRGEPPTCQWLGEGFYASGLLDSADPKTTRNKAWATLVFTPMQFPYEEGIWRGPLIVLVNGGTGSAAEQFAAVLQDNGAAVIVGAPTAGAGCGHTDGGTPTLLKNSGGVLELPDCVRFRADGSNANVGIQPDVLVGLRREDGPHRAGKRLAGKLAEAVERALQLSRLPPAQGPSADVPFRRPGPPQP